VLNDSGISVHVTQPLDGGLLSGISSWPQIIRQVNDGDKKHMGSISIYNLDGECYKHDRRLVRQKPSQ
jgi:hypothetical protein